MQRPFQTMGIQNVPAIVIVDGKVKFRLKDNNHNFFIV